MVGCNSMHDFIIVLQEATQDAALQLIDKLATRIVEINTSSENPINACYGVTQCQRDDDAETMLERAESALTEARQNDNGCTVAVQA
jgi:PleD family two-component response regulator